MIEVACNGMFGVGGGTMIGPPDENRFFPLKEAHAAVVDPLGWSLYHSFLAAVDMATHCEDGTTSQRRALFTANAALNAFDRRDRRSWTRCLGILQPLFASCPLTPLASSDPDDASAAPHRATGCGEASRGRSRVHALGHCHIDTAWLWPIAESARKARRSWSSVLDLAMHRQEGAMGGRGAGFEGCGVAGPMCAFGQGSSPLVFAVSQPAQMHMLFHGEPIAVDETSSDPEAMAGAAVSPQPSGDGKLWQRFKAGVAAGRVVPVGGMWVEPDANMPCGEAWVRQMMEARWFYLAELVTESEAGLYLPGAGHSPADVVRACAPGQDVATAARQAGDAISSGHDMSEHHHGAGPTVRHAFGVAWLPDTFGMQCGQLPQILRGAGIDSFLTQKLSWSLVHKHPHTTFHWRAPDGSRVLAHFPPADSYNTKAAVSDVLDSCHKNKDIGRCDVTGMLYGHGDGGGGPTAEMMASLALLEGAQGMPELVTRDTSPVALFEDVAADTARGLAGLSTWDGEIHLELHQGTYTSIPAIKRSHQDAELALLLQAEGAAAMCLAMASTESPKVCAPAYAAGQLADLLPRIRQLLTCQFHDILPGTSIALAHRVAVSWLQGGVKAARVASASCLQAIVDSYEVADDGDLEAEAAHTGTGMALANSLPEHLCGTMRIGDLPTAAGKRLPATAKDSIISFSLPPFTIAPVRPSEDGSAMVANVVQDGSNLWSAFLDSGDEPAIRLNQSATAASAAAGLAAGPSSSLGMRLNGKAGTLSVEEEGRGDSWIAALAVTGGEDFHHLTLCTDQPWFWDAWDVMTDRSERARLLLQSQVQFATSHASGELPLPDHASLTADASSSEHPVFEACGDAAGSRVGEAGARLDAYFTQTAAPSLSGPVATEADAGSDPDADDALGPDAARDVASGHEDDLLVRLEALPGPDALFRVTTSMPPGQGMHFRGRRDSIRAVMRFQGLPTTTRATFDTAFAAAERPTTARTAREDMLHETCTHRWVALSSPGSAGAGVLVVTRSKHGVEVRGNAVSLTLDRRVEAPDAGPHAMGACHYGVAFFLGPLDLAWARRVSMAICGARPVLLRLQASSELAFSRQPMVRVSAAPSSAARAVLEVVKLPRSEVHRILRAGDRSKDSRRRVIVRVREVAGIQGRVVVHTPPATAMVTCDLLERPQGAPSRIDHAVAAAEALAGSSSKSCLATAPAHIQSIADATTTPSTVRPWWEISEEEWAVAGPAIATTEAPDSGTPVTAWTVQLQPLQIATLQFVVA